MKVIWKLYSFSQRDSSQEKKPSNEILTSEYENSRFKEIIEIEKEKLFSRKAFKQNKNFFSFQVRT